MSIRKFYETSEFEALNEEWKLKLKESGFNDIEKNDFSEYEVSKLTVKRTPINAVIEAVKELANYNNVEYEKWYSGEVKYHHKQILELYAEGKSTREISVILKNNSDTRTHMGFQGVARVIQRYLKK